MAGDWIKLHRTIIDSEVFTDDWLTRLFVWCLCRANFKDGQFRGQPVKRGQFVTGRNSAAAELGVSPSKWYRGIERLSDLGNVSVTANSNWTTITVCNFNTYQSCYEESEQLADSQRTSGDTTSGQPADTIEERNNSKNGRMEEANTSCVEPEAGSTPVTSFAFPVKGGPEDWCLPVATYDELRSTFGEIDAELTKARAWCVTNPTKRKTRRGMSAFLFGWLERANNRGGLARAGHQCNLDPRGNFAAREQFLLMMEGREHENAS